MLTLEENGWNFKSIEIESAFNLLPIQIDIKTGKIGMRSSKIRLVLWRLLFCLAISHCFYMLGRLVESTLLEPEKYFRWDHFIIHAASGLTYVLMYYTGFCVFVENPGAGVLVFNQLFVQRENPVQKALEQMQKQQMRIKGKRGKKGRNSEAWIELKEISVSVAAPDPDPGKKEDSSCDVRNRKKRKFGCSSDCESRVRPLLTWPPQYSLDEILARTLLLLLIVTDVAILLVFAVDLSRPQLLYSALLPQYQNVFSFLGLLAVESVFIKLWSTFLGFSLLCQLLFFGKCQVEFKQLELQLRNLKKTLQNRLIVNRDIRSEIWILRQILKEMKQLVLFIELFNRCFPPCIFAYKLLCLSISTLFYFFTIRHAHDFPFLAIFTGYSAIMPTLTYAILYQNAFSIPQKMSELKNKFLLSVYKSKSTATVASTSASATANQSFWTEMMREIWGIRDVGIKVGSFHTLERQSTPNFVDFVLKNVVNLLVTFSP